jgi:hypothetical protein
LIVINAAKKLSDRTARMGNARNLHEHSGDFLFAKRKPERGRGIADGLHIPMKNLISLVL